MPPQKILDSHIHLWPKSASNHESHKWMTEGGYLTKQHSIGDFLKQIPSNGDSTNSVADLQGFIYVETDRVVGNVKDGGDVQTWAAEPLKEIAFLRRVVEGTPEEGEGFDGSHSQLLKGIVVWAPLDRGIEGLQQYLQAAREVAGEKTWKRIRGCRYLVQGIKDIGEFKRLVNGQDFIDLLRLLGEERWSFDVGVDSRSGGIWQPEFFLETIQQAHEGIDTKDKTVFILNHLCKPDMQQAPTGDMAENFWHWKNSMSRLALCENVYMKLSGSFSEMVNQNSQSGGKATPIKEIVELLRPWMEHVFETFGADRIMFGSDWPVCTVRGPGEESWRHWKAVVEAVLDDLKLSDEQKDRVWFATAVEAYRLENIE